MENHDDELIEIRQGDFDRMNLQIVDLAGRFGFLHGALLGLRYRAENDEMVQAIDAALEHVSKPTNDDAKGAANGQ